MLCRRDMVLILVCWSRGFLLCPCVITSLPAKICPQATADRRRLSVCVCAPCMTVSMYMLLRACTDICVQCMCQGQLFLLFLSRASGKCPSGLSKHSFLQGTAIQCHHVLNKSFPVGSNTVWNLCCSTFLLISVLVALEGELVWCVGVKPVPKH